MAELYTLRTARKPGSKPRNDCFPPRNGPFSTLKGLKLPSAGHFFLAPLRAISRPTAVSMACRSRTCFWGADSMKELGGTMKIAPK